MQQEVIEMLLMPVVIDADAFEPARDLGDEEMGYKLERSWRWLARNRYWLRRNLRLIGMRWCWLYWIWGRFKTHVVMSLINSMPQSIREGKMYIPLEEQCLLPRKS